MSGQYVSETGHEHYKWTLLDRMSNPQKIHGQCNGVVVMQGNDGNQHRRGKRGEGGGKKGNHFAKLLPFHPLFYLPGTHTKFTLSLVLQSFWAFAPFNHLAPTGEICFPLNLIVRHRWPLDPCDNSCFWESSLCLFSWAGQVCTGRGGDRASWW